MATRSGGGGLLYGLILFVFLFIFSLAMAILFYSQKLEAEDQVTQNDRVNREFVSETEQRSDAFQGTLGARGDRTVYGELSSEMAALKRKLVSSESATLKQIEAQLANVGIGDGESAVSEINELKSRIAGLQEQLVGKTESLTAAEKSIEQLGSKLTTLTSDSQAKIDSLTSQFNQRTTEWEKYKQSSEAERQEVVQKLKQAQEDARAKVRAKEAEIRDLNTEIARLNSRIDELATILKRNRLSAPDMTLESDGRIVDVDPRESIVYINLGREDRLILGMTFEVFDAQTGVQTEIDRAGRTVHVGGKATIEVIRFSESGATAICRVVRQSYGQPVVTGDLISNIVYDKNRTFRFFVYGDFDLNGDKMATPIERQRVVNLIEQWGGEVIVADEMPVDTDFLVLGQNIGLPAALPENPPPTKEQVDEYKRLRAEFTKYQELAGLAADLSIPLLNQNRFLTLIGYYEK